MTSTPGESGRRANVSPEMAEYLQTFVDETEEQLEDLIETILALEADNTNTANLNEAFRLIHSIKGSAGMMGLDSITVLTHHLESRFERFRSGAERLDDRTMSVVLRCIDFLNQCNQQLRADRPMGSPAELLDELKRLSEASVDPPAAEAESGVLAPKSVEQDSLQSRQPQAETGLAETGLAETGLAGTPAVIVSDGDEPSLQLIVRFAPGLQLVDLKAQLIVARLSTIAKIHSVTPDLLSLAEVDVAADLVIHLESEAEHGRLLAAAEVDGVEAIDLASTRPEQSVGIASHEVLPDGTPSQTASPAGVDYVEAEAPQSAVAAAELGDDAKQPGYHSPLVAQHAPETPSPGERATVVPQADPRSTAQSLQPAESEPLKPLGATSEKELPLDPRNAPQPAPIAQDSAKQAIEAKVSETLRVDIERLDSLLNLTGELVVNRARLQQVLGSLDLAWHKNSMLNRIRDFTDRLRDILAGIEAGTTEMVKRAATQQTLAEGVELLQEQCQVLENGRKSFDRLGEAMDQLALVSHNLQRGVLDTRMVPIAPLFNRFKRVVRDLSKQRGKNVRLEIRGEKTELDKRMIDELGDPLVHLVRNSIDHGLESIDERKRLGKSEQGCIVLEASHSGNNVFIHVRDDGAGINIDKIRAKLISQGLQSPSVVAELSDSQILDFIWHPGFSTADRVSDVSGRGVGMDVVRDRITSLNGTVEVDSVAGQGTTFALRLPLTLAIMDCLLVRLRNTVFAIPIDDVREITAISEDDVVTVNGRHSFELRGEYLPLVCIEDVFYWRKGKGKPSPFLVGKSDTPGSREMHVVILQVSGKTSGLRVDELLGSQDIVIKSLSDNFGSIHGLSGASILGDGSVCLMLDVGALLAMALRVPGRPVASEVES